MPPHARRQPPAPLPTPPGGPPARQARNARYLLLNNATGAASGLLFWLLFARVLALPPEAIGTGAAVVALGTLLGLLAKGGFDTALVRHLPRAPARERAPLARLATLAGVGAALALAALAMGAAALAGALPAMGAAEWALVAAIAALLVITWLQDARFLGEGHARPSFHRHLAMHATRLALPFPVVALALPAPVPLTWAAALGASALLAWALPRPAPVPAPEAPVPRRAFLRSAARNLPGGAAEFLPGLLLPPLVLGLLGPAPAASFAMAWAAASVLFVGCAAIGRSALAEMARGGWSSEAPALRRAAVQLAVVVGPLAAAGVVLAPLALAPFGPTYAQEGAGALAVLCASTLAVGPVALYLAWARARERTVPLVALPAFLVGALLLLAPPLAALRGLEGVALAWLAANAPLGAFAAWRLRTLAQEVSAPAPAQAVGGGAHVE